MSLTRRGFLTRLAAATAAATVASVTGSELFGGNEKTLEDLDRILWTPEKTIIDLGAQKRIIDTAKEVRIAGDEEVADLFSRRSAEFRQLLEKGAAPRPASFGRNAGLGRVQRLALSTIGGYGEFTLLDGQLQGGPDVRQAFERIDKPFLYPREISPRPRYRQEVVGGITSVGHDQDIRKGPFYDLNEDLFYPTREDFLKKTNPIEPYRLIDTDTDKEK